MQLLGPEWMRTSARCRIPCAVFRETEHRGKIGSYHLRPLRDTVAVGPFLLRSVLCNSAASMQSLTHIISACAPEPPCSVPPPAHVSAIRSRLCLKPGHSTANYTYEVDKGSAVETTRCNIVDEGRSPAGSAVYQVRFDYSARRAKHEFNQISGSGLSVRSARWTTDMD